MSVLQQPGHFAAGELGFGFGFRLPGCITSVYAACGHAGQVVAVGHGSVVLSAHAADRVVACYVAGVVAVGHGAVVISAHAADMVVAFHAAGVVAVGHGAEVVLSAQAADKAVACYAAGVVAVGHGARVISAHAADIVPCTCYVAGVVAVGHVAAVTSAQAADRVPCTCYGAGIVAVGHGAGVVISAHAADMVVAFHAAGVVAVGHGAELPSAQAADRVATFDIACLYAQVLQGSALFEDAHQALVVCSAVDINAAYAVAVAIQGAGEWLAAVAYRRPGVCRSGASPVFPALGVVQQDVGGQLAVDACLPAVHHRGEACQLRSVGNQVGVFRRTVTARKAAGYRAVPYVLRLRAGGIGHRQQGT